jgi:hypothetical protein
VRRVQRRLDAFPALGNAHCIALDRSIGGGDRLGGELQLLRGRFEPVLGGLGLDLSDECVSDECVRDAMGRWGD